MNVFQCILFVFRNTEYYSILRILRLETVFDRDCDLSGPMDRGRWKYSILHISCVFQNTEYVMYSESILIVSSIPVISVEYAGKTDAVAGGSK